MAQPAHDSQHGAIGDHPGCRERVRPQVVDRVDEGDAPDRRDDGRGKSDGQGRMIDIHDVGTPRGGEAVDRQRDRKRDVVEHSPQRRAAVAGVERQAVDRDVVHRVAADELEPVSGIERAAGIVRESGHHADIVAVRAQRFREIDALQDGLGLEPLRRIENSHRRD